MPGAPRQMRFFALIAPRRTSEIHRSPSMALKVLQHCA